MTYTRAAISTTNPANSERYSLGAQRIRELAVDLTERLLTICTDLTSDPLTLKTSAISGTRNVTGAWIFTGGSLLGSIGPAGGTGTRFRDSTDANTMLQITDAGVTVKDLINDTTVAFGTASLFTSKGQSSIDNNPNLSYGIVGHLTLNFAQGNYITCVMQGNYTLSMGTGICGQEITLVVMNDGTAGRVCTISGISWGGLGAPALPTGANKRSIIKAKCIVSSPGSFSGNDWVCTGYNLDV